MRQYIPIILASGVLAFLVTPITRILARRVGLIDQPGLRKAHRLPVPLLGGLAIYAALAVAFIAFGQRDWQAEGAGILGGATLLFLTGLWDDRYGMPVWIKLAAQAVAAVCVMAVGVQVHLFGGWPLLDWLITLVWVVGITNAANLMDNMDGLAAGTGAVAAVSFFVLASLEGQGLVASLAAALVGASLGFLFYNFTPAVSFMGDAGALPLGFLLAVLGIKIRFVHYPLGATWMAPIVVLGVLIFDTALVVVSRLRRGRSPFQGGSDHTSHRLVQLGLSQSRAVLTLYVTAAALGVGALWITRQPVLYANAAFGALVLGGLVGLILFERVEPKLTGDPALVLIPGGGGFADAVRTAAAASRDVTVLFAPRQVGAAVCPSRSEVIETLAALADDQAAVRRVLASGLRDEWWLDINDLNRALRLHGLALVVYPMPVGALPAPDPAYSLNGEPHPEALAVLRRARLILLGPGDPEINIIPALVSPGMRAALRAAPGPRLWVGAAEGQALVERWLGEAPAAASSLTLQDDIQARLITQAAAHAKTSV